MTRLISVANPETLRDRKVILRPPIERYQEPEGLYNSFENKIHLIIFPVLLLLAGIGKKRNPNFSTPKV